MDIISDSKLRNEFVSFCELLLDDYYIDDVINDREVYTKVAMGGGKNNTIINSNIKCNYARGFDDNNNSYDFMVYKDEKNGTIELICQPSIQKGFDSDDFGHSFSIKYSVNNQTMEISKLSKNALLREDRHLYVRDDSTNDLVLISEERLYDHKSVLELENKILSNKTIKHPYKKLYKNGKYLYSDEAYLIVNRVSVTKMTQGVYKLFVNNVDTNLVTCPGTILYGEEGICPIALTSANGYLDRFETLIDKQSRQLNEYYSAQNIQEKVNYLVR